MEIQIVQLCRTSFGASLSLSTEILNLHGFLSQTSPSAFLFLLAVVFFLFWCGILKLMKWMHIYKTLGESLVIIKPPHDWWVITFEINLIPIVIRAYPRKWGWLDPTPTLHLARFNASSIFKPTLLLSFSTCIFHVFLGRPHFLFPFTSNSNTFLKTCPLSLLTHARTISLHWLLPPEPLFLSILTSPLGLQTNCCLILKKVKINERERLVMEQKARTKNFNNLWRTNTQQISA